MLRLLIFIFVFSSGSLYASNKYQLRNSKDLIPSKKIQLTKLESRIVRDFNYLFKKVSSSQFDKKVATRLSSNLKKSTTFYKYRFWVKNLLLIKSENNFDKLKTICSNLLQKSSNDLAENFLYESNKTSCFNSYLLKLSKRSYWKTNYHKSEVTFFKENAKYILQNRNSNALVHFLKKFKQGNSNLALYSDALTDHLMENELVPSQKVLKSFHINPKLTRYLQTKDLNKYSTQRTFYREFTKLRKDILRFSDANPGSEQIKTMTRYALSYFNTTLPMQNKKLIYRSLLSLGKSLTRRKEFDLARDCFRRLIKEQTYLHEKVIFEYFWTYAVQGDYEAGLEKVIAKHVPSLDSIKSNSKLHFWIGLSHAKEGDDDKAKSIFKDLIKTNPLSYYAILSAKKLSKYTDSDTQEIYLSLLQENQKKQERNLANNSTDYHWLKRLIGWSIVNNDTLLNLEIKNAKSLKTGSDLQNHLLFAAYSLGNRKDYLESFKIIYQSVDNQVLNVNKTALKILFPQPFFNQIKTKTKNFDPVIALSLIRQESGFNTHAKSIVGARGLMQLMPNTAKRFKRRLKTRQLYNPRLNIQIGTTYFKKLLNRYDQNLVYALSAYNAGERRVDEWQEQYLTSDSILQNIENIPFLETRKYVKLIFRNIFFYKMLYNDEKTDSTDFNKIYDIHLGF